MTLEEFIKVTFKEENDYCFRPAIKCNDGFVMSVQGSRGHYCSPRETRDTYLELEIGYPSEEEELILRYAENEDKPTDSVYGYVPAVIIQQVIDKHGGINIEKTLEKR